MTQTEKELTANINALEYRIAEVSNELIGIIKRNEYDLRRLEAIVESAIIKSVHELIEYLRQEDIQSLDEQEFAKKVKELIFESDPDNFLPF